MTSQDPKTQLDRVPDLIKRNKDTLIALWLQRVKADPELITVTLSDAERRDHVPDLLDKAIAHACSDSIGREQH